MSKKIAVLVGSLRANSFSGRLADVLKSLGIEFGLQLELAEIADLPFYNQDLDRAESLPPAWQRLRQQLAGCDAVLLVTPEYNRSVPAALKNALDVGSRPVSQNVWDGKPVGIISLSIGAIGGFGANHHLRQSLACLNAAVMAQPEAYFGNVGSRLDKEGGVSDEKSLKTLQGFLAQFAKFVG
ncbi:MAG: NAD(P)H-dependent oxidoreductase [Lentisphaeria bacterium]|mgnify:CR=1 FL=1|jgi:chromate reductase|nr:NAD(P)H-dependent oxidoreductase [Lentisphaeria bacterium]MDY0175289.1 NAD(P)H-dependent oxidoreductase [Lentisphaeria bacterium]NLZ60734.1 NAD(P)H-dependent oxidoreductase [Lentisphaerota bacterium]